MANSGVVIGTNVSNMYRDSGVAIGPNVPIMYHDPIVIPPRIWKLFLMGTYSWMAASILYMLLALLGAVYYVLQTDTNSQTVVSVSYVMAIISIYWLSANVRDVYRYGVLRSDPQLKARTERNLGGPSEFTRKIRTFLSVAAVIAAGVVFVVAMTQTTADKITGCVIELQLVAAVAVFTKTIQDREDSKFLSSFDPPQANNNNG